MRICRYSLEAATTSSNKALGAVPGNQMPKILKASFGPKNIVP
jgi:hypothetical protein